MNIQSNNIVMDPNMWSGLPKDIFNIMADYLSPNEIKGMPNQVIVKLIDTGKIKICDLFANADDAICFAVKWNFKQLWLSENPRWVFGYNWYDQQLTDVGVRRLIASEYLSNLYKIDLRDCYQVTEPAFRELLDSLSKQGRVWTKDRRIKFKKGSK